ncbi:MAG: glycosyl hydrolase family 1 [Acidimicrobiia bacterium]|nr:glycosyl hydrolase family 1 [Acidimicrobiia bacterium]
MPAKSGPARRSWPELDFNGVGISQTASEGASPTSDWRRWEEHRRAPASGEGNGFATRFAEDFTLLASQGLNAVRLDIDWARLEPRPSEWSGPAVEHLTEVLLEARGAGLAVWLGLTDLAGPGWYEDEGGIADDQARYWWSRYVDRCGENFGDLVAGWLPFIEPERWARAAFLSGQRPPGRQDPESFAKALRGTLLAQRDAGRQLKGGPPIASCWNLGVIEPADGTITASQGAASRSRMLWDVVTTAQRDGVIDIPGLAIEEVPDLSDSVQVLGFTYRGSRAIGPDGSSMPYPLGETPAEDGTTFWAEGLGHVIRRLVDELPGRPLLLAGFGVGTHDDRRRVDLVRNTADVLAEARRDGIELLGWFADTGIDAYDPRFGFELPRGLFTDDREARPSAEAFAEAQLLLR